MATSSQNLKVQVSADTSKFQKGMKDSKSALRDFRRTSNEALGSFGNLFGVNSGKVQQLSGAVRGLGVKLAECGASGSGALGKIAAAAGGASTAIAAIGIGPAIAAFKLLNSEADNFKQTVAGANMELQTAAYVQTFSQAMHDFNSDTGKSMAETTSKLKEGFGKAWNTAKAGMVNALGNWIFEGQGFTEGIKNAVQDTAEAAEVAGQKAEQGKRIAGEQYQIQLQQSEALKTIASLEAQISLLREQASDTTLTAKERLDAINQAEDLINQKYNIQRGLANSVASKLEEMNSLTNSTPAQIDAANRARAYAIQLTGQQAMEQRALNKLQGTLTKEVEKETEARKRLLEVKTMDLSISDSAKSGLTGGATTASGGLVIPATVRPEVDIEAMKRSIQTIQMLTAQAVESMSTALGELAGDLVTGGDAWSNFSNAAIGAFGDMAVTVGRMAISTGTATLGIKAALESLNGYVAIAAGAALVALGSAVKAGLSNVASGNYSASANVASYSSSFNSGSSNYATRDFNVKVTGTLKASGSQLVAVISNEETRKNHTT